MTRETTGGRKKMKRLVVLDSHAILHRAYHALPDFSSSKGEPTGALYGLLLMLLKIIETLKPDYIVAARDLPGRTHRHEEYDGYKATRAQAERELIEQLGKAPDLLRSFGVPVYESPGYEADDVIGAIVEQLKGRDDVETIIATGDMDTLQLVSPRVSVFTLRKGLSDTVLYDAERVAERFGFGPEGIVDYKALRGDPSDNIPGVRGIGEKTATELIVEFGSLDALYRELARDPAALLKRGVKPRVVQLLAEGKKQAELSKSLAAIRADAPVAFTLPQKEWEMSDHAREIAEALDRFEFRSLRERLQSRLAGAPASAPARAESESAANVDSDELAETAIALWLLRSDITNPSLDDVLHFANERDFPAARAKISQQLHATGRLREVFESIERPLIPVVRRMQESGVLVDTRALSALSAEYGAELARIAARIYAHAGREFNINSPKQLADVLFDEMHLVPKNQKKTATGARTTREEELAKMAHMHPIVGDVLAHRELQKLLSTYIEKMPKLVASDGRLHAEFLQAGTTTGRMASQNPNLQNIPIKSEYGRRIRSAFTAAPGYRIAAIDYSQIELRIAAGLSGDEKLVGIFTSGGDVHAAVAARVFGVPEGEVDYEMRRRAKVINFGILYGMGVNALRANLGAGVSREEASRFLSGYFEQFPGLAAYIGETKRSAAKLGYTETLFGRRRYFPGFASALPNLRAQAERMAVNAPIQGTQADIIKLAMVRADELIEREFSRERARLLMQVHDELVYEVAADSAEKIVAALRGQMESVLPAGALSGVPIVAEASVGENWGNTQRITTRK